MHGDYHFAFTIIKVISLSESDKSKNNVNSLSYGIYAGDTETLVPREKNFVSLSPRDTSLHLKSIGRL